MLVRSWYWFIYIRELFLKTWIYIYIYIFTLSLDNVNITIQGDTRRVFDTSEVKSLANVTYKNTHIILLIEENNEFMNQCKWYTIFDLRSDADIVMTNSNTCRVLPTVDSITWLKSVSNIFEKKKTKTI